MTGAASNDAPDKIAFVCACQKPRQAALQDRPDRAAGDPRRIEPFLSYARAETFLAQVVTKSERALVGDEEMISALAGKAGVGNWGTTEFWASPR